MENFNKKNIRLCVLLGIFTLLFSFNGKADSDSMELVDSSDSVVVEDQESSSASEMPVEESAPEEYTFDE